MTRKLIALMLIALLILQVGCRSKNTNEETVPAEATEALEATEAVTETLHPALVVSPFDDEEEATAEATEPEAEETAEATEESTEPTEVKETEAPTDPTDPTEETEAPTQAPVDDGVMTYEEYMALSAEEQYAFMNSFESIDAFFEWFNAAKAAYEAQKEEVDVGDGSFDLGELGG